MGKAERHQKRLAEGWQAIERGDLRAAEETARASAPDDAPDIEVARLLGASLFLQGRFPEAIAPLRKVYLETQERKLGCQLGHCYLAAGDPKNAEIVLERVTRAFPDFGEALNLLGIALIQQGRHEGAVKAFTSALERSPRLPATYNNLGNALLQVARNEEAIALFRKAIALEPGSFQAHNNLGRAYKVLRRYDASIECYKEALRLAPGNHEVHNNLGAVLADLGRHEEAIDCYRAALAINPKHALAHNNLGVALDILGRHIEAIECFKAALLLSPDYIEAHTNLGIAYQQLKRFDEAISCHEKAIALKPDDAGAHTSLGSALQDLGRLDEAVACHRRALSISPDFAEAHNNLGAAYRQQNLLGEAIECHLRALAIRPDYAEAQVNLGMAYQEQRRLDEAIACYERAISLRPDRAEAHANLGAAFSAQKRFDRAIAACEKAISLKPDLSDAHHNLGGVFSALGRHEEAIASAEKALKLDPDRKYTPGALVHSQMMICDWRDLDTRIRSLRAHVRAGRSVVDPYTFITVSEDLEEQKLCTARYVQDRIPGRVSHSLEIPRYEHPRIRVAYLSADFREHAVAHCIAELLELHDRSKFEIIGVPFGGDVGSEMRTRMAKSFHQLLDVSAETDESAARLIRALEVDIAIDLMGYTKDCRPEILACRPAPIQVGYLGYPGTMAAEFMDYLIADRFVLPEEHKAFYSEKVVCLPESYQVNDSKREIAASTPTRLELGLPETGFVFCCFNNSYKFTPAMFDVWMRLLKKVPRSVLWVLKDNAAAGENLRKEAKARGVDPLRLVFASRVAVAEYRARCRLADLCLDTLPYNGHGTTGDMLWAGLPVLTCAGTTFAGRVGSSLLRAVGLPELVTRSLEEYEALAMALASDPRRLGEIRRKLERNRSTSPLFDTDRFRRNVESAYTTMWEIRQRGEKPRAFAVDPVG
ncbi:MAG TPA: tetratricopeptide repeat protein [Burkholderiales bacterium]